MAVMSVATWRRVFGIRAIDLGHHCLHHRRARRHLGDGHLARPPLARQRRQQGARLLGDLVAAALAFLLVQQLHLDLGQPGVVAQIVVTHHAVEVERTRGAGIGLQCRDLGDLAQLLRHLARHVGGRRQGGALRHVDHDRELRLVVVRQHLHRHRGGVEHRASRRRTAPPGRRGIRSRRPCCPAAAGMTLRNSFSSFSLLACSACSAFSSCAIDGRMRIAR